MAGKTTTVENDPAVAADADGSTPPGDGSPVTGTTWLGRALATRNKQLARYTKTPERLSVTKTPAKD